MADIQAFLTKKAGPLPVWGWAAAGGGLVSVFVLSRRGAAQGSSATAGTGQSGQQPNVPYVPSPIIVTTGNMPESTSSINPPAPSSAPSVPDTPFRMSDWVPFQGTWEYKPNGQYGTYVKGGIAYSHISNASQVTSLQSAGGQVYYFPAPGVPAPFPSQWFPASIWTGTPVGGGGGAMNYVPGSGGGKLLRFNGPHAHSQYLATGVGGGGHGSLTAISQKTGVPVGRLMSLNPRHWQHGRRRPGHIHIA